MKNVLLLATLSLASFNSFAFTESSSASIYANDGNEYSITCADSDTLMEVTNIFNTKNGYGIDSIIMGEAGVITAKLSSEQSTNSLEARTVSYPNRQGCSLTSTPKNL